jgi:hypothetical protein
MWFQSAVAAVSIRLAEPSLPTIWAPSSRPVWRSAVILTVRRWVPGKYAARVPERIVTVT